MASNNEVADFFLMQTWMYLVIPLLGYAGERILIKYDHKYKVNVNKVNLCLLSSFPFAIFGEVYVIMFEKCRQLYIQEMF